MFAYCENNPIIGYDPKGEFTWITGLIGAAVGAAVGAVSALVTGGDVKDVVISAVSSAAAGFVIGMTGSCEAGAAVGQVVGSAICAAGSYIDARVNGADCETAAVCAGVTFGMSLACSSTIGTLASTTITNVVLDVTFGFETSLCYTAISTGLTNKNVSSRNTASNQSGRTGTPQSTSAVKPVTHSGINSSQSKSSRRSYYSWKQNQLMNLV